MPVNVLMEQYEAVIIRFLSKSHFMDDLTSLTLLWQLPVYTVLAIYAEHIDGKNKRMMSQKHMFNHCI